MKYTYGSLTVTADEHGIVTQSDSSFCQVGQKINKRALVACGWKKEKKTATYYSHGQKNSTRFLD